MAKSLRHRIMLVLTVTILIMFIISSMVIFYQAKGILQTVLFESVQGSVVQSANGINDRLERIGAELTATASMPPIKSMDWEQQAPILTAISNAHGDVAMLFIADTTGNATSIDGTKFNVADRDYFKMAIQGKVTYSHIIKDQANESILIIAAPIEDKGIIGYATSLDFIQKNQVTSHVRGTLWIMDENMMTIAHTEDKFVGNAQIFNHADQELKDIASRMVKGHTDISTYQSEGHKKVMAFAPIKATGWSMALNFDLQELLKASTSRIKSFVLVITCGAIAIGAFISFLISNRISQPIVAFKNKTKIIAQGDLTQTIDIEDKDEISQLAESFNTMIEGLRHLIERIGDASSRTYAMSQEISASTEEISASIEEVSASTEEFAASTAQLSQNTNEIALATSEVEKLSSQGMEQMKRSQGDMQAILKSSMDTKAAIGRLNTASENIKSIVEVISDIADQTNLLALNAAIEAARVGEHGRGFAVVADEVRKLAEGTQKSVGDIKELIEQLISEMHISVATIEENNRLINKGAQALDGTASAFADITKLIQEVTYRIEVIATASLQLSSGSQEIAAASNEESASMEQITTSIEELARLSQDLNDLVSQFKV